MTRCLITGFEPFGSNATNPSMVAAKACALSLQELGVDASSSTLPVTWEMAKTWCQDQALGEEALVVHIGLAANRTAICLEQLAWPEVNGVVDNEGRYGEHHFMWDDDPGPRRSSLDLSRWRDVMSKLSDTWHVALSEDAGRYICNAIYWSTLEAAPNTVFIHMPQMSTEQAHHVGQTIAQTILECALDD